MISAILSNLIEPSYLRWRQQDVPVCKLCANSTITDIYDHGRRKRGVCRGSDTPTIYVEGILICISP